MDKTSHVLILFGTLLVAIAWPIAIGLTQIETWQEFLNSAFAQTFISTLVAAFAGAWGAQFIVEREKEKSLIIQEIRDTNSALATASHMFSSFCGLKTQHLENFKKEYDEARVKVLSNNDDVPQVRLNLQAFPLYDLPDKNLRDKIHSSLNLNIRGLALADQLSETISLLNDMLKRRNSYVEKYNEKLTRVGPQSFILEYLGIIDPEKIADLGYPSIVNGVWLYNEDCIYYTSELCKMLNHHGRALKGLIKNKNISVVEVDFSNSEKRGLIPSRENYTNWENGFIS